MTVIPIQQDLDPIVTGDDRTITLNITDSDETIDVGSWSAFFTMKNSSDDTDANAAVAIASSAITTSTLTTSTGTITIPFYAREGSDKDDTALTPGTYGYDIQVIDEGDLVHTWFTGKIKVLPQYTQRTS